MHSDQLYLKFNCIGKCVIIIWVVCHHYMGSVFILYGYCVFIIWEVCQILYV